MHDNDNFSEKDSLRIIREMIDTAKKEQKDDGKSWILWGWLLFVASVFTWANIQFNWYADDAFFWNALGVIVILYWLYRTVRYFFIKPAEKVNTYTSDLLARLNIGFFIFLFLIIFSMNLGVPPSKGFSLLMGLYGFWILVYGTALNFKPSIIGAYLTWAIAFASLFIYKFEQDPLKEFQWVMLFQAFAVLCGYIIPGHIANTEFKKIHRKDITSV